MNSLVKLEWQSPSTALVQMQDLTTKNTLSKDLITQLATSFTEINNNQQAKVVILTGLESQFCCGNSTLDYQQEALHHLLLNCELPIIAAVQGDALGDGLALAAFADVILLAEESNYSSNYLDESMTPGMGAAYILPKKLGSLLGAELLFSSQQYTGHLLKARNTPIRIIPKEKVLATAMELTKDFDEKLSVSLRLLKKNITDTIKLEILNFSSDSKFG